MIVTVQITATSLRFSSVPKKRAATRHIVIHHAASSKTATAATIHAGHLANGWVGIGYHFFIRWDGTIERGRPIDTVGAHCVPRNADSVGVCLAGNFEQHPPSTAQIKSLVWLIRHIHGIYPGLPISGHNDHDATACPGRLFPMADVRAQTTAPGLTAMVNGRKITAQVRLVDGRVQVQVGAAWLVLRDLVNAIPGASADWDAATKTAYITIP